MPEVQTNTIILPCSVREVRTGKTVIPARDYPHTQERATYRFEARSSHLQRGYWLELRDLPGRFEYSTETATPGRLSLFKDVRSFRLSLPGATSGDEAQDIADRLNAMNIKWDVVYSSERAAMAFFYMLVFTPALTRLFYKLKDAFRRAFR